MTHLKAPLTLPLRLRIDRQQINHRENKHPNQIDKVPVQAADLDVFVFQFLDSSRDYKQVNAAREHVEHVHARDAKERCPESG